MTSLPQLLQEKRRPLLVELDPPRQATPAAFFQGANELCQSGADVITVADCPTGRVSIDASLMAAKLKREYGIEVLPHMACRDRNLNAIQALMMGLSMEQVSSVLLITGDPVAAGDREKVKGVFQLNSCALAKEVGRWAQAGVTDAFFLCGALNVNARNFQAELDKARRKEESGIRAFLTQPLSSRQAVENVLIAREQLTGYLLPGLFPMVSYKNVCFLQREVAGMRIDEDVAASYIGLDAAQGEQRGVQLCVDAARETFAAADGYYIMTPFHRIALVKRLMAALRALG